MLLLLGFLALLFVVGGGAAIWYFAIRESGGKDTGVVESPRPAGWERFSPAGGGFAVYVPDTPEELPEMEKELAGTGCTGEMYMVSDNSAKTVYVIGYITFPSSITRSDREKVANEMIKGFARGAGGAREIENKKVRMGGRDATEVVYEMTQGKGSGSARIVARVLVTGSNAYILIVGCENGRPKASDERGFFDSFELTSGAK